MTRLILRQAGLLFGGCARPHPSAHIHKNTFKSGVGAFAVMGLVFLATTNVACLPVDKPVDILGMTESLLEPPSADEITNSSLPIPPTFSQNFIGDRVGRAWAWSIGVADFNEDGIDDIVSGDTLGDVHLYLGKGDGTFNDLGFVINMQFDDAYALATGDFNGDGFQDFVLSRTGGSATPATDGEVVLYLGNGDGTFQATGLPQVGIVIGDAGTDVITLAAADVDGDGDVDIVAGDVTASDNGTADVTLFRNQLIETGSLGWTEETIISASGGPPDPELPPYFPPTAYLQAYGLAFGDTDGDGDQDLLVSDLESYLYVYQNDGTGTFLPIRYERIATYPFAYARLHETSTSHMPLATGDLNGDGLIDIVAGGTDGQWEGKVDLWLNEGLDGDERPSFLGVGVIGGAGIDARGLAVGQINPSVDSFLDVVFGNREGDLYALLAEFTDTDEDGIVDVLDNAPTVYNPDQADSDHDGIGDVIDGAMLTAEDVVFDPTGSTYSGKLVASLANNGAGIIGQTVTFSFDADGDGTAETFDTTTDANGVAFVNIISAMSLGPEMPYTAVWDGVLLVASDTAMVSIGDTTPPVLTILDVGPSILWPPNHKMVEVTISVSVSDDFDPDPKCKIVSVTSSEPENGQGDGNTDEDWQITGDLTVNLRAERSGKGTGRTYTISLECSDASGNTTTADATVTVPHNRGHE